MPKDPANLTEITDGAGNRIGETSNPHTILSQITTKLRPKIIGIANPVSRDFGKAASRILIAQPPSHAANVP